MLRFRVPGITVKRAVGVAAIGAAAALAAPQASAGVTPGKATPDTGVQVYNANACGKSWVKVRIPGNSYYNFYNAPTNQATTCIKVMRHHLDFQITKIAYHGAWGYPNISSGWESNRYSCTWVSGACSHYPVQEKHDGNPVTSVATYETPGTFNTSYDIWFNKTDAHPLQDNGTEVMIWLQHPGIRLWNVSRYVVIDGIHFAVMTWIAHNAKTNTSWYYVAYVAQHQTGARYGMHLNPIFADAIRHGELSPNWWLTGIDFGWELVHGGLHNNVHYYSLTGVR
jgi:hypothetical protein